MKTSRTCKYCAHITIVFLNSDYAKYFLYNFYIFLTLFSAETNDFMQNIILNY